MSKPNFVHLHVHSHYSLLDGLGKVDELVNRAKDLGMSALALTDHGVMHGAIEFYNTCKKAGIKPIIGEEAYVSPRKLTDKSPGIDAKPYHMVMLAKNHAGYKNLIKMTSAAHLDGYYYKPRIDRDLLSRHAEGIIGTSACLASETSRLIMDKNFTEAERVIREYQEILGPENFFLELQHHPSIAEQQVVNMHITELAKKMKAPLIVTNDTHYVNSDDHVTHDQLVCIQTGRLVSDTNRMLYTGDFSLKSPAEMAAAFPDLPEAIENTVKIADMVDLEIAQGTNELPAFPLPKGETEVSYLKKMCEDGLRRFFPQVTPEIRARLDYEFEIVVKMGFPGYFLIVADFARFAREQGIYFGCRGSAAGSLISYIIGITDVNPLKYDLLFERFLDVNRISMPDIDMDFEDARRGEVIDYVRHKYGDDHVAGVITFGTIMARAAVRDVGRVLGMPYQQVDAVAKVVPTPIQGRHVPLARSVTEAPELKAIYDTDPEAKLLLDAAMKLEGTIRHASQHACAIVISNEPLNEYVPVQESQGGDVHQVTQYSMEPIEKIGLLKMDFLGLANWTIMRQAVEIIKAVYGAEIDIHNLPLDDKKVFELLGRGDTTGVFQLESSGMKRYIRDLQPNRFEDIVAMVALYRPGPMQWIQNFIDRKNGREDITYLHPLAENALKDTYGIPIYQEQVMRMSKDMCGFTGAEADTLRKAIGKKIPKLMKEMKEKFITGAVKNGVKQAKAGDIWNQMEDFAAYCFNKSHAVCYALMSFQTAYLKAYFPDCFMAALMTSDLDDTDRLSIEISESERIGLKVLPPDVNQSFADFGVVKGEKSIRFGLAGVKNVGHKVAEDLVKERKKNGEFKTLEEFLERCAPTLNKKVLESLVKAGALDRFGTRASLWAGLELICKYAAERGKGFNTNQASLFGENSSTNDYTKLSLPAGIENTKQFLSWEKELLGLYLSDHPFKEYMSRLEGVIKPISEVTLEDANKTVRIAGIVQTIKKITTKSNQMMAFAQIEDLNTMIEAIVFPTIFADQQALWESDAAVLIEGKVSDKDGSPKILVDKVWPLDTTDISKLPPISQSSGRRGGGNYGNGNGGGYGEQYGRSKSFDAAPTASKSFIIELPRSASKETLANLKKVLADHPGPTPVELRVLNNGGTKIIATPLTIKTSSELVETIAELLGSRV